jgi:SAM-dependent methyltransferase
MPSATYEFPETPYYQLFFMQAAFASRLAAIESAVLPQSRVLDLGCNDGRISCHLLKHGRAREVTAIDQVDSIGEKPAGLSFLRGDLCELKFEILPREVDVVLFLNLAHHLVHRSRQDAKSTINHMLSISPLVLLDMGSFTEQGPWGWRREYDRHWSSDAEMWDDLFEAASYRRALFRYFAQHGGSRVLWQLSQKVPLIQNRMTQTTTYKVLGRYRRAVEEVDPCRRNVG